MSNKKYLESGVRGKVMFVLQGKLKRFQLINMVITLKDAH